MEGGRVVKERVRCDGERIERGRKRLSRTKINEILNRTFYY